MAQVNPWTTDTYKALYAIFRRDFVDSRPYYRGSEVWHFPEKDDGKEVLFWHLTTREHKPEPVPRRMRRYAASISRPSGRYPDLRRCERLPWVRPMIENSLQPEVLAWDYREGDGDIHTYVWLKDRDFVVIMKKYRNGRRRLITSFYVDEDYKRRDFERKYAERIA
jgi:hypothetical protein